MLVLGIETSCDETAVAVLKVEGQKTSILSDQILSQSNIHEAYGGIVPELASRAHLSNLPLLVSDALTESKIELSQIDLIAFTRGPGLLGCLLMGASYAQGLAFALDTPCLGVNHIEAHVQVATLSTDTQEGFSYPYLALVASGGHTELLLVEGLGRYHVVARTGDDAAGEAFDKSAHLLGFAYPGGPKLAALADTVNPQNPLLKKLQLPKVMREASGFSFSGLKTAIQLLIKQFGKEAQQEGSEIRACLAFAIQDSIVSALMFKLEAAVRELKIKRVVLTGGVAANANLRTRIQQLPNCKVHIPVHRYCMDNAVMIAHLGAQRFQAGQKVLQSQPVISRWPVESIQ